VAPDPVHGRQGNDRDGQDSEFGLKSCIFRQWLHDTAQKWFCKFAGNKQDSLGHHEIHVISGATGGGLELGADVGDASHPSENPSSDGRIP
jgi:hypothetical protein